MSDVVLSIEHLTTAFAQQRVVDDLSFDIRSGEMLALVGEKTTLQKVI